MENSNFWKLSYGPFFAMYFGFPIIHDVIPGCLYFESDDWFALLGLYAIGVLIALPMFALLRKSTKSQFKSTAWQYGGAVLLTAIQMAVLISFWFESTYLYLASAIIMGISCVFILVGGRKAEIFKDRNSGAFYCIRGGKAYPVHESELSKYQSKISDANIPVFDFASASLSSFDSNTSGFSVNSVTDGFTSNDYKTGMEINPSSGMPMVGGISGLDVHGNSWGTSFNEPSNTYDPGRGY